MAKRRRIQASTTSDSAHRRQRANARDPRTTWWVVGTVLLIALVAGALLLLRSPAPPVEITAAQAFEKYQAGAFFLDVRTEAEWNQSHIANSVLIPLDQLSDRLAELPRDRDIVVVCRSGTRSKEGAAILQNAGFTRITCLSGGLQSWVAAGYPLGQ